VAESQDDPDVVRREYADDKGLTARISIWSRRSGPQPQAVAFAELTALGPRRVLEVGCGRGEFAEQLVGAGIAVIATDQSEHMVALTRARGVDARVADVQELPFGDGEFDAAAANFMLYHVPDLDRGLAELARVAGTLVAATNGIHHLQEMWDLVGRDLSDRRLLFMRENGEEMLKRHFDDVRMIDLPATVALTSDDMRHYISHSVAHRQLAGRVPDLDAPLTVTASTAVFVAS
jgi:SAM-dependent methyltransferase